MALCLPRRANTLGPGAVPACLGDTPYNIISYTCNAPFVGLHTDVKDGPLNIIAWTHVQGLRETATTTFYGGAYVLPALRVLFTPAATSDVTLVLVATATLTHGTMPLTVTPKDCGERIGTSHFLRCEDVRLAAERSDPPVPIKAVFRPVLRNFIEALHARTERPAVDKCAPWLPYANFALKKK